MSYYYFHVSSTRKKTWNASVQYWCICSTRSNKFESYTCVNLGKHNIFINMNRAKSINPPWFKYKIVRITSYINVGPLKFTRLKWAYTPPVISYISEQLMCYLYSNLTKFSSLHLFAQMCFSCVCHLKKASISG